jgi:tripartite-type tricarboxylate transporter receptor subunit TctC
MADRIPPLPSARPVLTSIAVLTAALASGLTAIAAAQNYPVRPITLVVPFPPGGSTTIVARIVTDRMADAIGRQFVVDNRGGGAGGTLGTRQVARSTPDGYTIALGYSGTLASTDGFLCEVTFTSKDDPTERLYFDIVAVARAGDGWELKSGLCKR